MICAFSPSSVSGCDSLVIKHAVSGLCCVWVFWAALAPAQGQWYLVGRTSAGLQELLTPEGLDCHYSL